MRHVRMLGVCLAAAFAMSAVVASSALAIKNPDKSKTIFINCPVSGHAANGLKDNLCIVGATELKEGGKFTVGPITVPIVRQIILQYGLATNEETGQEFYVPPTHGVEAITPTPERVPGEPIAHITSAEQNELHWPESLKVKYKEGQRTGTVRAVNETIELAGIPVTSRSNLLSQEGTAVEAPVKIKGENKWLSQLGDVCYIGSTKEPIVQHLTSGKSTSPKTGETIEGSVGELEFLYEFQEVIVSHNVLVDNTYPVPGAKCSGPYGSVIAATIDKEFGIPAVAGASVTEIRGTLYNSTSKLAEEGGAT